MTGASTTIRVSQQQRQRLRSLAEQRGASMSVTLDEALEALRRLDFYERMAEAERELRKDPVAWADYIAERDRWLEPDLVSR